MRTVSWEEVDLDGARIDGLVRLWTGVLAWGERAGRPYAAQLTPDGTVLVAQVPGSGPVTSAMFNERFELVVGTPPTHLYGGMPGSEAPEDHFDVAEWTVFEDPARLWLGCGDEDPIYVATGPDGQLVAAEAGSGVLGVPSGIYVGPDIPLLVAGSEIGVYVAGVLRTGSVTGPQCWHCGNVEEPWDQRRLEPVPDGFTDVWEGFYPVIAGHRDGLPLLWNDDGNALDVPEVRLDESWPVVSVAAGPPVTTLALQSEDGPVLCTAGIDGWSSVDLPPGRLVVARADGADGDWIWVVIDGVLWTGA